jgi:tetratricopeptide (TPR) repeat protein
MAAQDELLQRGIAAARAGQVEEARQWLAQAIKVDPQNEVAWIWMSSVVQTNEQRVYCLEQVLAINPQNELALKGMQALGLQTAATEAHSAGEGEPGAFAPAPDDGVPLINEARINQAQRAAEDILRAIHDEQQQGALNIVWAAPEKVRVHTRPTMTGFTLTPQMMRIGGIALGAILIIVLIIVAVNALGGVNRTAGPSGPAGPTSTPSAVPRPTRTPTPAGTAFNPGPTFNAPGAPRGDLRFGKLTPTAPYVATPHPSSPRMNDALTSFFGGDYNSALDYIKRAREAGDNSVDGYWVEGMSLAYLGEWNQARLVLESGLERDQGFAPLHVAMAYVFEEEGSLAQARTSIERALQLDPKLALAYLALADLEMRQGNYNAALAAVEEGKTVSANPYDVSLLVMQGKIYLADGQLDKATAIGNLAYYIDPSSEGVVLLLAEGRMSMGLQNSAMVTLENYLDQVNLSSAESWALLGKIYNKQGRTAEATEANRRALQLSGRVTNALVAQALLSIDQGKYEEACSDLEQAIQDNEDNYEARFGRAVCSYALGDAKQALEDLEFVREKIMNRPDIETLYVQALVADQQWNKAISSSSATYNVGQLSREQRATVLENQAYAFYKVGDLNNAFLNIEAALKIGETGTRHYYRGLILDQLQDYDRAALEYEWVLFWDQIYDYPFADDAEEKLERLYQLMGTGTATPTPTASPTPPPTPTKTPTPTRTPTPGKTTPTPSKTPTPGGSKTVTPKPG